MTGDSSPINPPAGADSESLQVCYGKCRTEEPKLQMVEKDHYVACHLTEK